MTSSWYDRNDPRFRRTLNQITTNLESANESAQVGLFSFHENYIKPFFVSVGNSVEPCWTSCINTLQPCVGQCFPQARSERRGPGRRRAATRGRLEHSFDFYDDWEEDERDALLALDDDEFDRVVGSGEQTYGEGAAPAQPGKRKIFDYGAAGLPRRHSEGQDHTEIPTSSYFGFLDRLPFQVGRKLRYKPSAADLRDVTTRNDTDADIPEGDEEESAGLLGGRTRRGTVGSGHTTDSFSSRGDLFPSDEEADAVALDDEFTNTLTRRTSPEDTNSGRATKGKRPSNSRRSTRRSMRRTSSRTSKADSDTPISGGETPLPTMEDIKLEDERAKILEEEQVEKRREAAQQLAVELGLSAAPATTDSKDSDLPHDLNLDAVVASTESIDELGELDTLEDEAESSKPDPEEPTEGPTDGG